MADTVPPLIEQILPAGVDAPYRRHWDRDFGALYLVAKHGGHADAEVFDEFPPPRVRWASILRIAEGEHCPVLTDCDDIDRAANAIAQHEYVKRIANVPGDNWAEIRAGFILNQGKTLRRVPGTGWRPQYLPHAMVRFDVSAATRQAFRALSQDPPAFQKRAAELTLDYFKTKLPEEPLAPDQRLAFDRVVIETSALVSFRYGEFYVRLDVEESGAPKLFDVTWAG